MKPNFKRILSLLLAVSLSCGLVFTGGAQAAESATAGSLEARQVTYQSRAANFKKETWTGADNQKMIQVARSQLGQTAASLNYTEPWCADFTCDTAYLAGVSQSVIPWGQGVTSAYVPYLSNKLRSLGATEVSVEQAQPGDIVMFCWSRTASSGRSPDYALDHVAIVICYDKETKTLHYIGGNQTGAAAQAYMEAHKTSDAPSRYRDVTEVVYDTQTQYSVARIYRPKYATYDATIPVHQMKVGVTVQGDGTVTGDGFYMPGTKVTLTATPGEDTTFTGWYDGSGTLLSRDNPYTLSVEKNVTLTAKFQAGVTISTQASRSGSVTGAGTYPIGSTVTLTAVPGAGKSVTGWYDQGGNKLATGTTYSFTAQSDRTVCAMFSGDRFIDIPANAWYLSDAEEAASLGLVNGVNNITFDGSSTFTRAMAVVMISRIEGADTSKSPRAPFTDVPLNEWYAAAVNWAYENKVVNGVSATQFAPNNPITRQEFAAMMIRYINGKGLSETVSALPYSDQNQIGDWAVEYVKQAYAMRIMIGDTNGTVRPLDNLPRSEGTVIILRVYKYLKSHGKL